MIISCLKNFMFYICVYVFLLFFNYLIVFYCTYFTLKHLSVCLLMYDPHILQSFSSFCSFLTYMLECICTELLNIYFHYNLCIFKSYFLIIICYKEISHMWD